ncbi:MAG: transcription termination/antitermination NusG family protein [Planctomycetota bacterium]|jgi:transcription antitermination factor NusG
MSDNPPVLPPGLESLSELAGRWWVAHTKARFEKSFAWDLAREGIAYFLPMVERVRMSGGRKRRGMMPLFPSYVFFCGNQEDRYTAMTTHRLCQTLEVPDQTSLVEELSAIEKALAGKAELDPYPHAAVGQRCRVVSGPFRGLEGVVVHRNRVAKIVLEVHMLGRGAVMEIEADLLEAVA